MKILRRIIFPVILLSLLSCSREEEGEEETVHFMTFPGGAQTSLPYLFAGDDGLIMSWVKMVDDSTAQLEYSRLVDNDWQQPRKIHSGTDWFVNWADFPAITDHGGNLLTHFLQKSSSGKFSYDVKLNVLRKGASTWETGLPLHTDSTKTEHGFVSAVPYNETSFFVAWLDGRNTGAGTGHEHSGHQGSMSIRAAEVGVNGTVLSDELLDGKTCDCCQTTVAITSNGPIVVYRNRSDREIRDIAITRHVNGKWTEPKPIYQDGWEINGCPVNGPKVEAIGNNVVVAWFTAVNSEPKVQVAFSEDGGDHFGSPVVISGPETPGRVDVTFLDPEHAVVSWMETADGSTWLKAMKVGKSGRKYPPVTITEMDPARKSGFPQMERLDDKLYFAWTAIANNVPEIKTAYVYIQAL